MDIRQERQDAMLNYGYGVVDGTLYLDGLALADEGTIDPDARPFVLAPEDQPDYLARRQAAMEWLFGPGKTVAQVPAELPKLYAPGVCPICNYGDYQHATDCTARFGVVE